MAAAAGGSTFEGLERARYANVLTTPLVQEEMVRALSTTVNAAASESEIQVIPRISGVVTERRRGGGRRRSPRGTC